MGFSVSRGHGTAGSVPNGGNGPNSWVDLGDGTILFNAQSAGSTSTRLWRSDGTAAGTYLGTRTTGTGFTKPGPFTVLNGIAYFTDSVGTSWYRTDGTVSTRTGTALSNVTPRNAKAINGVITCRSAPATASSRTSKPTSSRRSCARPRSATTCRSTAR
jgi:ELWxxDGT repeat protein